MKRKWMKGTANRRIKKRRYIKKKRYAFKRSRRTRALIHVGFPRNQAVKLRYVESITINPGVAVLGYYYFRANSLFDPNQTGVGHQPMTFDMWAGLYNHYTVIGAKCTVHFVGDHLGTQTGCVFGVALTDDATSTSDPTTLVENGTSGYRLVTASGVSNATRMPRFVKKFSAKKFFSVVNPMDNTSRIGAPVTSNPTEEAYFAVFLGPVPGLGQDIAAYNLMVHIEYYAIFSEPKEQAQS